MDVDQLRSLAGGNTRSGWTSPETDREIGCLLIPRAAGCRDLLCSPSFMMSMPAVH
jgi:hypothetical protein